MELLERYLQAVGTFLPTKQQADILAELRANILSEVEEKETELGRPLRKAEEEDILRRHGHPFVAAASYGPRRYLIGPQLFPFYWLVLRIALVVALAIQLLTCVITIASQRGGSLEIWPMLLGIPGHLLPVAVWLTALFAALEACLSAVDVRAKAKWNPRNLPALRRGGETVPRMESAAQLVGLVVAMFWWQTFPNAPWLMVGPFTQWVKLGAIWETLHWPVMILLLVEAALSAVNLVMPHLAAWQAWMRMAIRAATLVILTILVRAGAWVVAADAGGRSAEVTRIGNQVIFVTLLCALVIVGAQLIWECVKRYRVSHTPSAVAL